jgi:hypothetical protein
LVPVAVDIDAERRPRRLGRLLGVPNDVDLLRQPRRSCRSPRAETSRRFGNRSVNWSKRSSVKAQLKRTTSAGDE